ncbi:MAG: oligosaccharide flippase family protein [Candidatus Latescibacterota bacterium]
MAGPVSLATRAVRGFIWVSGSTLLQTVLILGVYHYLDIGDMGRFEGALIVVMLLQLVGDLGFSSALVQLRSAGEEHFRSSFWLCLLVGSGLAAALMLGAPLLARLLKEDDPASLVQSLRILSWMIPFGSVSGVFRARLQRDLRYAAVSASETVSVLAFGVMVFALLPSMGMLGLLVASVFREVGLLAGLSWATRWWPRLGYSGAAIRQMMGFSLNFTGSRLVNYLSVNLPAMWTYQGLGEVATGYYRLAHRLTLSPLTRLATTLHRVIFPAMATIQDHNELLRPGYLRTVESLCLFCWPPLVAMCVFGHEVLALVLGLARGAAGAREAFLPLVLLGLATAAKIAGTMSGSVFMAKGKADWSLYWALASLAVIAPLLWVAVRWGIEGIALTTAVTSVVFLVATQLMVNRLLDLSPAAFFAALARPALVTLTVALPLAALRPYLPGPDPVVLLQGAAAGAGLYLLGLGLFGRRLLRSYWQTLAGRSAAGAV